MAKGEITFYFATLADLQAQLLETLGMGTPAGADRPVAWPKEGFKYPTPEPTPEAVRGSLGNLDTDMPAQGPRPPTIAPPMAGKTAIPLPELSEEIKAEIAAPPAEIPPAAAQAAPAPSPAAPAVPPPPEQNAPTLTPETLAAAPYPALLAFCAANPEAGVNPDKCGPIFFRPLVESKIKTYLETK